MVNRGYIGVAGTSSRGWDDIAPVYTIREDASTGGADGNKNGSRHLAQGLTGLGRI
jgi:hypothetical protein